MAFIIEKPSIIKAEGSPAKTIEEFVGRVNCGEEKISIARMISPSGWKEPGQRPQFNEYTVVLKGTLHISLKDRELDLAAGQAIITEADEWVRYSTPSPEGAEYIAVCLPAFSPDNVNRD
jgi:mannose-6-phosphate isomerase-like protein (cupin superfamily)